MNSFLKYFCIASILFFITGSDVIAQNKKHCFVIYDDVKLEKTDSTFSKSVVSHVLKVKSGDRLKVKEEFYKKWQLQYSNAVLDTNLLKVVWADSKNAARKQQKEVLEEIKRNPNQKVLLFNFEFEYEFSFEVGY